MIDVSGLTQWILQRAAGDTSANSGSDIGRTSGRQGADPRGVGTLSERRIVIGTM
ncbi:hypothetical protein AAIB46_22045 [Streptomyces sp. 35M1]|uniref:hypothetical protein n=1 Tax=Streptomyces sp. 35M1 TaxID=3142978 RepID=UPI003990D661